MVFVQSILEVMVVVVQGLEEEAQVSVNIDRGFCQDLSASFDSDTLGNACGLLPA